MSAFKLHTLKQKLWAIVAASFITRVVMFFGLPSTPSLLAPDEGTYAALAKWIGDSKPAENFPLFGEGLYLSGRSIIVPASFLYRIGLNELDAVRLAATIYALFSLVLIAYVILKVIHQNEIQNEHKKYNENLILTLFILFAFLPSHFVWSNLGLRESTTEFGLITTFIAFHTILHIQKRITFPSMLILVCSIVFTFSARPQVGWVLSASLLLYLAINLKNINAIFLSPFILCAVLFGSTLNLGNTAITSTTESTSTTEKSKNVLIDTFNPLISAGEEVVYKQEVNQLDAASLIRTQSCPLETPAVVSKPSTKFDTYFCIAWRAPYMVSTFLFRPIIGVDVTSTASLFAAIENIVWLLLFITIIGLWFRRRMPPFFAQILPTLIFIALYVLGASAYQGNMGTGFRHKSLVLWALLLLIFVLAYKKPRNNSQESAV
jgi:hypothetical protein